MFIWLLNLYLLIFIMSDDHDTLELVDQKYRNYRGDIAPLR